MNIPGTAASAQTDASAGDPVSRMLLHPLPRRWAVGMLAMALTTGLLSIGTQATET